MGGQVFVRFSAFIADYIYFLHGAFFVGMLCTRVERDRPKPLRVDPWVSCGWGVRCLEARVVRGSVSDVLSVV